MRRNITKYITLAATIMVLLAGCQRELLPEGDVNFGDGQIRYSISNVGVKSSADDVPGTGSLSLVSGDGKLTVPVTCEVSEGIDLGSGSAETKGALINTSLHDGTLPAGLGFTVSAYKGSTPQFENKTATKNGDYWTMDPPQYWPLSTNLTFYAYTNASGNTVSHTATSQTLSYTVTGDAAAHMDLMLGYYKGNGGNKGIAEMRFDHPLTAVRFKKGEMTGVTGIKSITISGLASGGTVVMDADGVIGNWTVDDTEEYQTEVTLSPSGAATTLGVDEDTKLIGTDSEGKYNGAFLLIPQTLSEHDVTVTVVLSTESGDDVTVYADITSGIWRAGMTNTYTLGYNVEDPELLPGIFSISETRYVQFSRGNLQATYHSSSNSYTWAIARNQYDYVGNAAGNTTIGSQSDNSILDTFGWTAAGKYDDGIKQYGINISGYYSDYFIGVTDQCCDWGETVGSKGTWSVLSSEDWKYLVETRKIKRNGAEDTSSGFGNTCQWVKYNGVLGLIIYPDEYDGPKYDINAEISIADFPSNCIFLPAAGLRNGSIMYDVTSGGRYWSNSVVNTDWAYSFDFTQGATSYATDRNRYAGQSVRLVQRFPKPIEYVEIAGLKWATENLAVSESGMQEWKGLNAEHPTGHIVGDYFQWAASYEGYNVDPATATPLDLLTYTEFSHKNCVSGATSKFIFKDGGNKFEKTCATAENYSADAVLNPSDDPASVILGGGWRMPTNKELKDLVAATYCAWDATDCGCYVFEPQGTTYPKNTFVKAIPEGLDKKDALLFFPACGYGDSFSSVNALSSAGTTGYYSSSTCYVAKTGGNRMHFNSSTIMPDGYGYGLYGFSIRPVHD